MSTTNLGIIKSEANPLTGIKVQLNTGGWFIAESSAIPKSKVIDSIEVNVTENGQATIRPVGGKEAFKEVVINTNVESTPTPPAWYDNGKDTVLWTRSGGVVSGIYFMFFLTSVGLDNSVFPYEIGGVHYGDSDFEYWADNYFDSPQDSITMAQWLKCVNYDGAAQEMETCNFIGSFSDPYNNLCAIFVGTH